MNQKSTNKLGESSVLPNASFDVDKAGAIGLRKHDIKQEMELLARFCYSLYKNNKEIVHTVLQDK